MTKKKILYGVCGIGNGHTNRALPILEHFTKTAEVMIFAHDNSFAFFSEYFKNAPSVKVVETAIPFYPGDKNGIDFKAAAEHPFNRKDIFKINCNALDTANREFGKPDLVITDYEPVSAQYAYLNNVPLVTLDQQSKYLCGDFPEDLGGFTFQDEICRLRMFFPKAAARIALSFFKFPLKENAEAVTLFAPTIKESIASVKRTSPDGSILVYISTAREFPQTIDEVVKICAEISDTKFHIFLGKDAAYENYGDASTNVTVYRQGDPHFMEVIKRCSGIVATAGHSLLSAAMYLGIPVYAIPVSPYEQHMNAQVINEHGFGISRGRLEKEALASFINRVPEFQKNIEADTEILFRKNGKDEVIGFLEKNFLS